MLLAIVVCSRLDGTLTLSVLKRVLYSPNNWRLFVVKYYNDNILQFVVELL